MGHDLQAHDLHDLAAGTSAFYDVAGAHALCCNSVFNVPFPSQASAAGSQRLTRLLLAATCCLASAILLPRLLEVSVPG